MAQSNEQGGDVPTGLDEAVRMFAGYVRGENGFDELDFKEWLIEWREQEIAKAKLVKTYEMMTEYVDWCNDHSSELDDGGGNYVAVKPTFLGFRRFMNDKLKALSQQRGK